MWIRVFSFLYMMASITKITPAEYIGMGEMIMLKALSLIL